MTTYEYFEFLDITKDATVENLTTYVSNDVDLIHDGNVLTRISRQDLKLGKSTNWLQQPEMACGGIDMGMWQKLRDSAPRTVSPSFDLLSGEGEPLTVF